MNSDLIVYFSCDPEAVTSAWHEGCICVDNLFSVEGTGTVGHPIKFADAPMSAEWAAYGLPGGTVFAAGIKRYQDATCFGGDKDELHAEAKKHSHWKPLYPASLAVYPDATQQTFDDVIAGTQHWMQRLKTFRASMPPPWPTSRTSSPAMRPLSRI